MFLGVDLDHWVPWQALVFLPSKAQVAKGASWVRCDVGIPARTQGTQQLAFTRSVEGAALDPPAGSVGVHPPVPCIQRAPQPWHECAADHRYEATGTLVQLAGLTRYPSRAQLERRGTRLCRQRLTAHQRSHGLTALAAWDPPRRTRRRPAGRGLLGLPARRRAAATPPMSG